jgi:hypothetical protein
VIAPVRTFVSYCEPARSRRTVMEMGATFGLSGLGFGMFAMFVAQRQSPFDSRIIIGLTGFLTGIVALVVGCCRLWAFFLGAVNEVRVTDQGVIYHGQEWKWDSVAEIRGTPVLPNGKRYLYVHIDRGGLRSRLSLPIEIKATDPISVVDDLRTYLATSGHDIGWRM